MIRLELSTQDFKIKNPSSPDNYLNIIMILHTFGDHEAIHSSEILVSLLFLLPSVAAIVYQVTRAVCLYILGGEAPVTGHKCSHPAVPGLAGKFYNCKNWGLILLIRMHRTMQSWEWMTEFSISSLWLIGIFYPDNVQARVLSSSVHGVFLIWLGVGWWWCWTNKNYCYCWPD